MKNEDRWREMLEGTRHDRQGRRVPTPYRCGQRPRDACYERDLKWYCSIHWAQLHGNGVKVSVDTAVPDDPSVIGQ